MNRQSGKASFAERHRLAIVLTLAYVIGFTTAFIAFALDDNAKGREIDLAHSAAVARAMSEAGSVQVVEKEEGLFMQKDGRERALSAAVSAPAVDVGFHTAIMAASVSPGGRFIHYCAAMAADTGVCQHFVYSVDEDTVYRLKTDAGPYETGAAEAAHVSWSDDDALFVGQRKADAGTRWYLR